MAATRIGLRMLLVPPSTRLVINPPTCTASSVDAPIRRLICTDEGLTSADDASSVVDDVSHRGQSVSRRVRNRAPATTLFSDVIDPFFPTRSLSQVMNMMDQLIDDPFFNRNWDVEEDDNVLRLRMDLPGLGKEDLKVVVERDTLVIRGEVQKEAVEEGEDSTGSQRKRYSGRIDLPANRYKVGEIKAEMKHGVLKLMVPKVKDEERQDVVEVAVDG